MLILINSLPIKEALLSDPLHVEWLGNNLLGCSAAWLQFHAFQSHAVTKYISYSLLF